MVVVSLLTDFSISDGLIGSMKGVILQKNPKARIVDLAHGISKFSIREGAYILKTSSTYFPKGTIFCVVIDPGVGTERRPIAVKTKRYFFIGPDNGVLYPALHRRRIKGIRILKNEKYHLPKVSHTFHGRDIFSPVAAYLSRSKEIFSSLGPEIKKDSLVKLNLEDYRINHTKAEGKVIKIDGFGNIIVNIPVKELMKTWGELGGTYQVKVGGREINAHFVKTFGEGEKGKFLLLEENHGLLQLSLKEEAASKALDLTGNEEMNIYRE